MLLSLAIYWIVQAAAADSRQRIETSRRQTLVTRMDYRAKNQVTGPWQLSAISNRHAGEIILQTMVDT